MEREFRRYLDCGIPDRGLARAFPSFRSIAMPATECLVPREGLTWYDRTYRGSQCVPTGPRVSPIRAADLSGPPRALIIAAEYDTLRDEAAAYAEQLQTAGIAASQELTRMPELHGPTRHLSNSNAGPGLRT